MLQITSGIKKIFPNHGNYHNLDGFYTEVMDMCVKSKNRTRDFVSFLQKFKKRAFGTCGTNFFRYIFFRNMEKIVPQQTKIAIFKNRQKTTFTVLKYLRFL